MNSNVRKPKRRLTDDQLLALGLSYRRVKAQAKVEEEHADELKAEILAEFDARGISGWTFGGIQIARRSRAVRSHNLIALSMAVGRSLYNRLTKTVIDTDKWNAAVIAGLVDEKTVKAVETEGESSPWIEVKDVKK